MALCEHCQALIEATPPLPPEFDASIRAVITSRGETRLTRAEWELLMVFYRRAEKLLSYDHIFGVMYGDRLDPPSEDVLKVHVSHLRHALQGSGWWIETRWAQGYRLTRTPVPTSLLGSGSRRLGRPEQPTAVH